MTDDRKWVEIRIKFPTRQSAKDQTNAFNVVGIKTKIKKEGKIWRVYKWMRA